MFKRTETHEPAYLAVLLLGIPAILSTQLVRHFNSVPLAFCISITTYILTLVSSIIIYRISPWHPLARYPGPIICKITKGRSAYVSTTGKQHENYRMLHERYGDIVRVGKTNKSLAFVFETEYCDCKVPTNFPYAIRLRLMD